MIFPTGRYCSIKTGAAAPVYQVNEYYDKFVFANAKVEKYIQTTNCLSINIAFAIFFGYEILRLIYFAQPKNTKKPRKNPRLTIFVNPSS